MPFQLRPVINMYPSLEKFVENVGLCETDLIVTNDYIVKPYLELLKPAGGYLYAEKYGATEPTTDMINAMIQDIAGKGYERIVAIGGGAVIDISKQLLFEDGVPCEEQYKSAPNLTKKRRLIAVPTTCGTGSEVTGISVLLFEAQKTKIGLVGPALFPDEAVLIPQLLTSLPYDVFAFSSVDALIHAVESLVSPKADVFSKMYSIQAIRLILRGYRKITEESIPFTDLLEDFIVASCQAGIAFSNAGCGGVHAMSFPLGGSFHIPHGKSNYYLFLAIFNEYVAQGAEMAELRQVLTEELESGDIFAELESLLEKILKRVPLSELHVTEQDIDAFVPSVIKNQQRLLVNMPVPFSEEVMKQVYMRCM